MNLSNEGQTFVIMIKLSEMLNISLYSEREDVGVVSSKLAAIKTINVITQATVLPYKQKVLHFALFYCTIPQTKMV